MKKTILTMAVAVFASFASFAEEGMWLPSLISQRIKDMQKNGFRLTAEDIYSVNQASLKDAVVRFGLGCTGEVVSDQGLLFTNYHCGYGTVQRHSSVEHDYLRDGFWAKSREEELPNRGLTVSFLERMEDVSGIVLDGFREGMSEYSRDSLVKANSAGIIEKAKAEGPGLQASVEGIYCSNQYFLFVYKIYRDVRLVGAPPSSVGKFGGDTDNWMWPRHTGDFCVFRIYAGRDNEPADYSEDNVPYQPKRSLRISRRGVHTGDFTMVYGFPARTREYVTAAHVDYVEKQSDPQKIALRTLRNDIQKKHMRASQAVRIQYSSKNAAVCNAWKKWQGECMGLTRMRTVESKKAYEERFRKWAKGGPYDGVLDTLDSLYALRMPYEFASEFYKESVRTIEILQFADNVLRNIRKPEALKSAAASFFKDYSQPIDEETFVAMVGAFDREIPPAFKPSWFKKKLASYGSVEAWKDDFFAKTILTDKDKVLALAVDPSPIGSDPAVQLSRAFEEWFAHYVYLPGSRFEWEIRVAYRKYMKGMMEFEPRRAFFPDANRTLRVSYGKVEGYSPSDGVSYSPVTTLKGVMEKDDPDILDYNVPQVLRDIYAEGGYENVPVCFLASNHTTGGNSGSPVLDARGNLIGLNFDRVWEGTMSDLAFDPSFCRNICLDVRYLLFIIEKLGHAEWLFDEMNFVD